MIGIHGSYEVTNPFMLADEPYLGVGHIGDAVLPGHPLNVGQLGGQVVPSRERGEQVGGHQWAGPA